MINNNKVHLFTSISIKYIVLVLYEVYFGMEYGSCVTILLETI
jgi:hypothetical protein